MSEETAVVRKDPRTVLRSTLERYAEKLAVFGVRPEAYIEAALMACVKNPALFSCTPESVALSLRQAAQTGLEIGRTAHLVPYGQTCTFIPDYKGLIDLAVATHKVVSIRTRCVYEGEQFEYTEGGGGPDLRHTPRLSGKGGEIVGAYAIADLRFGRYKVEWMTADEINGVRSKSKSWAKGPLDDWYGRKTVVRRLCKTLPSSAKLQAALAHDDAEGEDIPEADVTPFAETARLPRGSSMSVDYTDEGVPPRYDGKAAITPTVVTDDDIRAGAERAKARNAQDDGEGGYGEAAA